MSLNQAVTVDHGSEQQFIRIGQLLHSTLDAVLITTFKSRGDFGRGLVKANQECLLCSGSGCRSQECCHTDSSAHDAQQTEQQISAQ